MRIGIVGFGFMGRVHAEAWAKTPAQVVGVVSLGTETDTLAEQVRPYGAKVYPDLATLLRAVDVVDICTPTHLHYEMVLAAAAAGVAIVCEKPLARTATQGEAMLEACAQANVPLLVGHVVRFFPEYAQAKQLVDAGDIGQVAVVRLSRTSFKPTQTRPDSWFHDPAKSGGMMLDLMIHDFDYARWVAGEVVSVYAKSISQQAPHALIDHALAILTHADGALSHVEGGWSYPKPMFRTALEIAGSQGLIEHPAASSTPLGIYLHADRQQDSEIAVPTSPLLEDPYATQIQHFYALLSGQETRWRVTAEDGLAALRIALAALQSAQTGRPVSPQEVA